MLDVIATGLTFSWPHSAANTIDGVHVTFPKARHTTLIGPCGSGKTTLLRLLAGELSPASGTIQIGARDVTKLKADRRPLLYATSTPWFPTRWSVQHALIAALQQRGLDRDERVAEVRYVAGMWRLEEVLERRYDSLSSCEQLRVRLAAIESLSPAVLLINRLFDGAAAGERDALARQFFSGLRLASVTIISEPGALSQLRYADRAAVVDGGRIVQEGTLEEVYRRPATRGAAEATGGANFIPVRVSGTTVESIVGSWEVADAPFQGDGVAVARPSAFRPAAPGEDSDVIMTVEESELDEAGRHVAGLLTTAFLLRITLPATHEVTPGKLLALRFDPAEFTLLAEQPAAALSRFVPAAIPSLQETR